MQPQQEDQKAKWFGLGLAVGGAIAGVAVYLILRDRRPVARQGLSGPAQPINIWNVVEGHSKGVSPMMTLPSLSGNFNQSPPVTMDIARSMAMSTAGVSPASIATIAAAPQASTLRSYPLSPSTPGRLFTATRDRAWKLQVRVVGPAGSIGYFSLDAAALYVATPSTDVSIVPAGELAEIYLSPGSTLYGSSNMDETTVSLNITSQVPGQVP